MDLSTLVQFCLFEVARQFSEKRKRRAAILRRPLAIERLDDRCLLSGDPLADYQSALADAQTLYGSQQATEDATWQSKFQDAQDTLSGQLSDIASGENAFVQAKQQDISNTIAAVTTTEQNSEAAADQQAATDEQAADTLAQQQIQQAESNLDTENGDQESQYSATLAAAAAQLAGDEATDKSDHDSRVAADLAQHDSTVAADEAAVASQQAGKSHQANETDTDILSGLQSQVDSEAASRDSTINGAVPAVDPGVIDNDPGYQSVVGAATSAFNSAVAGLHDTYNNTMGGATALAQYQLQAPQDQLNIDDATAQRNYASNQHAASDAYNQAMAPIQTALDNALASNQSDYDSNTQAASGQYSIDMQTAADGQTARQQTADDTYNAAAQPLIGAYNQWNADRTNQYNSDIAGVQAMLATEISDEDTSYATKDAGYAAKEQTGIQAANDAYNSGVGALSGTQAASDQAAWDTYNSAVQGARQTMDAAQDAYNDTVNKIYEDAMNNGTDPDQSALSSACATLEAANHAYSNSTAGAAVALQKSLGDDENAFATGEGPLYVTKEDAIATAQGGYAKSDASAAQTKYDNEADDNAAANAQATSIASAYANDCESHYENLQLQLAPLVQAREDAYADAAQQYQNDSLGAWNTLMSKQADAAQEKRKLDADAWGQFDTDSDVPWQTLQEQLAQADATLADQLATANSDYNARVTAAQVQYDESAIGAQVAYDAGVEGQLTEYINEVAPAWAASIIGASGNDFATIIWANAWAAYMMATVADTESVQAQLDAVNQSAADEELELGIDLSAQVSEADKTLADEAGAEEVTLTTKDTNAILAADAKAIPAAVSCDKAKIDNMRGEATKEINADVQDGKTHANDENTRDKAYDKAKVACLQEIDPTIANDDAAERTKVSADVEQAGKDEAAAIKTVDAATNTETVNLVADGEALVDKEANADKEYVKAEVHQAVDAANAQAQNTASAVAAEPDSDFPEGETIGAPGIYVDTAGIHAAFMLPLFDANDKLMGYKYFAFFDASFAPGNPGGRQFNIFNYIGGEPGYFQTQIFDAKFNPEQKLDYFVPSTVEGVANMLNYAQKAANGQMNGWLGWRYDILDGRTCVGFVYDTMDEADLCDNFPLGWWSTAWSLHGNLFSIPGTVKLPNGNALEPIIPFPR